MNNTVVQKRFGVFPLENNNNNNLKKRQHKEMKRKKKSTKLPWKELIWNIEILGNGSFTVSFSTFLPSHLCVDISIQVLINECIQLSPWGPCLNPCAGKVPEATELRWPVKQDWQFLAWLCKLQMKSLFFYFLYVITYTALWMCVSSYKTNKQAKKESVKMEKELSMRYWITKHWQRREE